MDSEIRKKDMTAPVRPTATGCRKKNESTSWLDLSSLSITDWVSNQEFNLDSIRFINFGTNTIINPNINPAMQPTLPIQVIDLMISSEENVVACEPKNIPANFETSRVKKKKKSENAEPATNSVPIAI